MKKPHILFISTRDDLTTDYLAVKAEAKNIPYVRINSEDLFESKFIFTPEQPIRVQHKKMYYDFDSIKGVIFRRAPSVFPDDLQNEDAPFLNRERREFLEGLFLGLHAKWINPIHNTYVGERKVWQLKLAYELGLLVPKTIITNELAKAKKFQDTIKNVIVKPISHGLQVTKDATYSIYTSTLNKIEENAESEIFSSPILIQENIIRGLDIRVTIIGERVFPVAIYKNNIHTIDWRRPEIKKTYKKHTISQDLTNKLLELNKKMGLIYSAIDLIQDENGQVFFLETNPAGEWLWLEKEIGLPLSDSFLIEIQND